MPRPSLFGRVEHRATLRCSGMGADEATAFLPLHVMHLDEWCPDVMRFLGLPPGWRFLVADGYQDVWDDPSLLIE
jgi:hypothetical protein